MSAPPTDIRDHVVQHVLDHSRNPLSMLGAAIAYLRHGTEVERRIAEVAARAIEAEISKIEREAS